MSSKVSLSVVVITKNEADRIRECLESVRWADEIVLVDDFSTDETVKIAKEFTPRVYERRMDIEGRHRNAAYALASHEWVLSLDADERVTPELAQEITELLKRGPDCNGYAIGRRNFVGNFWARHGGMYPSAQLRLFKKSEFRYDERAEVHPQAYMKDPRGNLKNDVLHYTYRNFTDAVAKLDRQTDLEAKKWFREKRKVGIFSTLRKMVDRFWRAYVSKKGYKDGVVGLFLAVNAGMYQFLSFAKYWELKKGVRVNECASVPVK
ncbi:MAG: glycosyltransferase family 2 protein [Candidatus Omnitrophica bacterium]|nr:glycosyltransferase family 2 protein [Candidatus Omnitrophota bacterium]